MATQNMVPPSDGPDSIGSVNFEGLGFEESLTKGLKEAYAYAEKILKAMEKTELSSSKIAKNLKGESGSKSMNIGLASTPGQRALFAGMGALAVGSIGMAMAPNTMAAVTQRIAADTTAGISGMSANRLIGQSNRLVGGGATSAMGPTMAAMGIMYSGGYTASSLSSRNIMSQLGGISAISGMSNEQAAAALSQANGMNFLRAGISIRNSQGQLKAPNQMINDVYNFLYRGRNITAEQAAMVYNPGSKGYYTISQLAGGNQQLMGILQAGVVARARSGGQALSADTLGNAQRSLDLLGVGKDSPIRSMFKYNTSEARVLQNTQQGLVGGYNAGLGAATDLNNAFASVAGAAQGVTDALMGLKGFLQTFPSAGNVAGTASGLVGAGASVGMNILQMRMAGKLLGLGKGTGSVLGAAGRFGKVIPGLGAVLSGAEGYMARKGHRGIQWGSLLGAAGTGAAFGAMSGAGVFSAPGALIGGLIGGGANLLGQLFAGGGQGGPTEPIMGPASSRGTHQLHSPVPSGARITSTFGPRTYRNAQGKVVSGMHKGIDYGIVENTPLYAVDSGTILKTAKDPKGFGNYVVIQHGDGRQSLYGHLNKFIGNPGKKVNAGDIIGMSGGRAGGSGSGNSTGAHLHFEYGTNVGAGNGQLNPLPLIKQGGWLSRLVSNIKGFLGFGPSPRGNTYGTEANINLNRSGGSGNLSSSDITSLISGFTHGSEPISYSDVLNRLGASGVKRISNQSIDYSSLHGGVGKVSHKELMTLLYRKGFKGKALETAYAVAMAESSGRPGALGDLDKVDAKWGPSIGLFQIRSLKHWQQYHDPYRDAKRLTNPEYNVAAAFDKSIGGTNWKPWATFVSGKFAKFLGDAAATRTALKIPARGMGGNVSGNSPYVVGEGGPEVFIPNTPGTIIPNPKAKALGVGLGGKSVNINVKMDVQIAQASPAEAERMFQIFATKLESKLKLEQIGIM